MGNRSSVYKRKKIEEDNNYFLFQDKNSPSSLPAISRQMEYCNKCNSTMDLKEYQECSHNYTTIHKNFCSPLKTTGLNFHWR